MRRSARSARRRRPRGKQKRARVKKKEKSLMKMRYEMREKQINKLMSYHSVLSLIHTVFR